jgi:hypothetical protein
MTRIELVRLRRENEGLRVLLHECLARIKYLGGDQTLVAKIDAALQHQPPSERQGEQG